MWASKIACSWAGVIVQRSSLALIILSSGESAALDFTISGETDNLISQFFGSILSEEFVLSQIFSWVEWL